MRGFVLRESCLVINKARYCAVETSFCAVGLAVAQGLYDLFAHSNIICEM